MTLDFEADTRPLRDALAALLDAFPSGEVPSADSAAMREISQEAQWTDSATWGNPVQFAHSLAAIQTHMAVDDCRAYLLLVEADPPVTFGVAPPARAAIEAFGCALALYDAPTLTDRVVIAMNDRLETLYQQDRLPTSVVGDADPLQRTEQLLAQADTPFGLEIVPDRRNWIGARRAGSTEVVRGLLDRWGEHIGSVAYNFLSAVNHALGHGINQFMKANSTISVRRIRPHGDPTLRQLGQHRHGFPHPGRPCSTAGSGLSPWPRAMGRGLTLLRAGRCGVARPYRSPLGIPIRDRRRSSASPAAPWFGDLTSDRSPTGTNSA